MLKSWAPDVQRTRGRVGSGSSKACYLLRLTVPGMCLFFPLLLVQEGENEGPGAHQAWFQSLLQHSLVW